MRATFETPERFRGVGLKKFACINNAHNLHYILRLRPFQHITFDNMSINSRTKVPRNGFEFWKVELNHYYQGAAYETAKATLPLYLFQYLMS